MDTDQNLVRLNDGRQVRRDAKGQYRDLVTGRWVSAAEVEDQLAAEEDFPPRRQVMEAALLQAALNQGHVVETVEEAIGKVVQVQAEIALDKDEPAKATAAARLLNKVTGFFEGADPEESAEDPWFVLGRELAVEVLALVEEEQARREDES